MTFDDAVALILEHEGGYVDDPRDPGGATRYGISKRAYPDVDIAALTQAQAAAIYKRDFWEPLRCGDMPAGVGIMVFDCAVNQGPGFAAVAVQKAANVEADGKIGPRTLVAIQASPGAVLDDLMRRRIVRYVDTRNFETFGTGWLRRTIKTYRKAVTWASI